MSTLLAMMHHSQLACAMNNELTHPVASEAPKIDVAPEVLRVKRYANRKIYVPEAKGYINFLGLYETILSGRDVRVTCMVTGRDVTTQVLGMIYQAMCVEAGTINAAKMHKRIRSEAGKGTHKPRRR